MLKTVIRDLTFIALGIGGFLISDGIAFAAPLEVVAGVVVIVAAPIVRAYAKAN